MIIYFSGTNNSKNIANTLARELGEVAMSIEELENKDNLRVTGLVCPTYAWGIPSVVSDFLNEHTITKKYEYLFFIATYGTTPGQSGYFANKSLLNKSNIEFDAYFSIKMVDTWTPMFDVTDKEKNEKIESKVKYQLTKVIRRINHREKGNFMKNYLTFLGKVFYKPYYNSMRRTDNFKVLDRCVACGYCEDKCPSKAIKIVNEKPVWIKDKCTMCLRCLHSCPTFAIQYGNNTIKHGQYKNPNERW